MEPLPNSTVYDIEDVTGSDVRAEESSDSSLENTNDETDASDDVIVEAVSVPTTTKPAPLSKDGLFSSQSRFVARKPWLCFGVALLISAVLSVIGLIVGDFQVAADNAGWRTRGTLIADRHQQVILVLFNRYRLFYEGESAWEDLTSNVQSSWEADDDDDVSERQLVAYPEDYSLPLALNGDAPLRTQSFKLSQDTKRRLQENIFADSDCDSSWYSSADMVDESHLWPIWRTKGDSTSALDPQVIRDLCVAEETTQAALAADGLCYGCGQGRCLPPYSLVFFARLTVQDFAFNLTCDELSSTFSTYVDDLEDELQACADTLKLSYKAGDPLPESCPFGFSPSLIDEKFGTDNSVIRYTSSIFASSNNTEALYEKASEFDRAGWSSVVEGAYDTQYENFVGYKLDDSLTNDMILAMASAGIVAIAILVHTRSPWMTVVGLLQIILSFPLSYFVYNLIARLEFFPFLNFIGIFVVFALGADDVFVAVDKWKNARLEHKTASTEDIAAIALPDAAGAMFLTTITTAIAFFATAICKVAPLKAFAIFCGLLVTFDYIMCVLLVFPALCIYDRSLIRGSKNCCISCHCCHRLEAQDEGVDGEEKRPSLIRRILTAYYKGLHCMRWGLLLACVAGFIVTCVYASRLTLPTNSDVRLLDPDSSQFEVNYQWRLNLLSEVLLKQSGSQGYVIWGVHAADTGHHIDPDTWSQLVLDESFDPSSMEAQEYLLGFCDDLYSNEFAAPTSEEYVCPINAFDSWLQEQSNSSSPSETYMANCTGATSLPIPRDSFDECIIAWSQLVEETFVLQRSGKVKILLNSFQSRVRYDSPYDELKDEWNTIEAWMTNQSAVAPLGVKGMYFSSEDFWWNDTNSDILRAAYGAAAIALAAAALVILFSSRSFVLTLFGVFAIAFILTSVTSMLVASGWTLGFLESICFAIAIGISCDFVIHFAHAYSSPKGDESRSERTKYALIRMGPSILAAAFTTVCSATVMIFTTISFFQKFAVILFFTILMATIGSFVVFITLTDCIGPSKPTYLMDLIIAKTTNCCCKRCKKSKDNYETDGSSAVASSNGGQASVVDGRRTSLYSDLDSFKASIASIEGRRSSLYSDLESLRQSTNTVKTSQSTAGADTVDERRSSLYADLENL